MSDKLKPCLNDRCIGFIEGQPRNCVMCTGNAVFLCALYQPEKSLSAWELFRELYNKYDSRFKLKVIRIFTYDFTDFDRAFAMTTLRLLMKPEPEALAILKEIKQEIENER